MRYVVYTVYRSGYPKTCIVHLATCLYNHYSRQNIAALPTLYIVQPHLLPPVLDLTRHLMPLHGLLVPLAVQNLIHLGHHGALPPPPHIISLDRLTRARRSLQTLVLPDIRLHAHAVVLVLGDERQPRLDDIRVAVLDLDEAAHGDALEVLLRLLEDEVGPGDGPALGDAGQGDGPPRAQPHVIGGAHGEVGEQQQVLDRVGAQLQVAHGHAVLGLAAERAHVDGADVEGRAELVEGGLGLCVEGFWVRWELDALLPVHVLEA